MHWSTRRLYSARGMEGPSGDCFDAFMKLELARMRWSQNWHSIEPGNSGKLLEF